MGFPLDAIRALCETEPPDRLPPCDLGELADVLAAHGLAPMASYQLENRLVGAGLPDSFRERLLTVYQGVVNDNLYRLLTLRRVLKEAAGVPAVVLGGAAFADWRYPHLAFRPLGELRLAVRGQDGARFAEAASRAGFSLEVTGAGGRTATFGDGKIRLGLQEGLWPGAAADPGLFQRARPHPAFGPSVARPAPEDALLGAVAGQALLGLYAPLHTFVDLRRLLRLEPGLDLGLVRRRAADLGLERALSRLAEAAGPFLPGRRRARPVAPPRSRRRRAHRGRGRGGVGPGPGPAATPAGRRGRRPRGGGTPLLTGGGAPPPPCATTSLGWALAAPHHTGSRA